MQISLKIIRSINHAKSTVCIKFQLLVTFSSLFTASSSLPVFPPSVLYISLHPKHVLSHIASHRLSHIASYLIAPCVGSLGHRLNGTAPQRQSRMSPRAIGGDNELHFSDELMDELMNWVKRPSQLYVTAVLLPPHLPDIFVYQSSASFGTFITDAVYGQTDGPP